MHIYQNGISMELIEKLKFVIDQPFQRLTYTEAIDILRNSKPNKKKFTGDARYKGGNVEVVVTMADGKTDKKSYAADLVKNHPDNYDKNE